MESIIVDITNEKCFLSMTCRSTMCTHTHTHTHTHALIHYTYIVSVPNCVMIKILLFCFKWLACTIFYGCNFFTFVKIIVAVCKLLNINPIQTSK